MKGVVTTLASAALALGATGCAGLRHSACPAGGGQEACDYDREAKTLLSWAVCKEKEDKPNKKTDKGSGNGKDKKENGGDKEKGNGEKTGSLHHTSGQLTPAAFAEEAGATADGNGNGTKDEKDKADDKIVTDRPDFTEASSTVGRGRVQLEAGYTYTRDRADGVLTQSHFYPEMLLRVGVFTDWFEFRVGQNFVTHRETNALDTQRLGAPTGGPAGSSVVAGDHPLLNSTGALDLYLGTKLALTEQKGAFPETAVILQATVPTGARAFTANEFLPGVSLLYGWDLSDNWSLAGSLLGNRAVDDDGHGHTVYASSLSLGHSWSDKVGGYFEYFGFYPHGATAAGVKPEYYLNGGFTYLVTKDFQLDIRAGFGLNRAADDFFAGTGFAVRY